MVWVALVAFLLGALGASGYYYYHAGYPLPGLNKCLNSNSKAPNQIREAFEEPKGELPAMPAASKFLGEIDPQAYPEAKAPETLPMLAWDFSGKKVCAYDYTQKAINATAMGSQKKDMGATIEGKGDVFIRGRGNGTGEMAFKNLKVKMNMAFKDLDKNAADKMPKEMEQEMPPQVIQGLKEGGANPNGASQGDLMNQFLFPLPGKALQTGESVSLPMEVPFNAMGSVLYAKGTQTIKLTNYATVNGRLAARLETIIDVANLEVPKELEGTYKMQVKGKSVFYFNVEDRCFESGASAVSLGMRVDAPTPKMNVRDKDMPKMDFPKKMRMVMDSDNLITVKRNPQKEKE